MQADPLVCFIHLGFYIHTDQIHAFSASFHSELTRTRPLRSNSVYLCTDVIAGRTCGVSLDRFWEHLEGLILYSVCVLIKVCKDRLHLPQNSMSTTTGTHHRKERQHFRYFFPNVSFITSILFGISTSASLSLPALGSFFGRDETAEAEKSASLFAWATCINGGALILSLLMQLLQTSPSFLEFASSNGTEGRLVRRAIACAAWISLLLAAGGMALVAEGLKIVQREAGFVLQMLLCAFCVPVLLFWIVFKGKHGFINNASIDLCFSQMSQQWFKENINGGLKSMIWKINKAEYCNPFKFRLIHPAEWNRKWRQWGVCWWLTHSFTISASVLQEYFL